MPARLDWECEGCGKVLRNLIRPATAEYPRCPSCSRQMIVTWAAGEAPATDLLDTGGRSFEFEYDSNSPKRGQKVQVRTMEDTRRIQRECERMAADGLHRPVVFRGYEQDSSNMGKNVFGERPEEARRRPVTRSRGGAGIPFVKRVGNRPSEGE